jgi:hypothetical protein
VSKPALLRRATLADLDALLHIKATLMLPAEPGSDVTSGGFLLGTTRERYAHYIETANVLVLESRRGPSARSLLGFAVTLPDAELRRSDLWERRHGLHFTDPALRALLGALDQIQVGYFEQLAMLPDAPKRYAPALAFAALRELLRSGHDHVLATVVHKPVRNLAPRYFLDMIGAHSVGTITELYPEVGTVTSEVYYLCAHTSRVFLPEDDALYPLHRKVTRLVDSLGWAESCSDGRP